PPSIARLGIHGTFQNVTSAALGVFMEIIRWFSFASYPHARLLCNEHVTGNSMHILWQSYATEDDVEKVAKFYERDQKANLTVDARTGARTMHAPDKDDDVISIIKAADSKKLPSCAERPTPTEQTVILVSRAVR